MAIAYYLLRDDDHDSRKNIVEMAKDLELSTHLDCVDFMLVDDEFLDPPYIAY